MFPAEKFPKFSPEELALAGRAWALAEEALAGRERTGGHPFTEHLCGVALIACDEIGLGAPCVAAVFLHEACTCGNLEFFALEGRFPADVLTMVDGLNKIATIRPRDTRLEAENYRKLIVSYSKDPRVVVLKLADRLEVMRHLDYFSRAARERKILETLLLYIPLAHQLGLYNMKSEMEDTYFRYARPDDYRAITNRLKATEADRQKLTVQFIEPLKARLSEAGIRYRVKARTKTAFSIWKKMQRQHVDFDGVYDVFAMRFVIDCEATDLHKALGEEALGDGVDVEKALCWKVFSYVTQEYRSDPSRLRDWISQPKPNGYESLHITVINADGACLEVQIRTERMDRMAESGLASHWSYKGIRHEAALDAWLSAVRSSLESGATRSLSPPDREGEDELPAPPEGEIFVFTPTGELRKMPQGATVLDFAFEIHSLLGCRCTGGKINGRAVPIREKLHTGDYVEVLSSRTQSPKAEWLQFVVTSKARTKIRQSLASEEYNKADEGRELLLRRLRNWRLELRDEDLAEFLKKHQFKTVHAFYAAIGEGTLDIMQIKTWLLGLDEMKREAALKAAQEARQRSLEARQEQEAQQTPQDELVLSGSSLRGLDFRMAKCCRPSWGDEVFGFVSIHGGVKIHRFSCPNAARLLQQYPYRIQKVRWTEKK